MVRPLVGTLPEDFPTTRVLHIPVDRPPLTCRLPWGTELALAPFFGVMGVAGGTANPSRDMLIRRAAPPGATGRVYGVVYSGLDVGMSIVPPIFGLMMDAKLPALVWLGIAFAQATLIAGAFRAGRATRARDAAPDAV